MKRKRLPSILTAVVAGVFGVILLRQTLAAPGQFAVTPSPTSVQSGNNVTLNLRIHPTSEVDGVDITLTYDQSKLQYVSTNPAGSAFSAQLSAPSGGGGTVRLARGITPGEPAVSGDSFITQVTFKALTGSGSTGLNLSGDVSRLGASVPTATGTGTVNFTSPTPPPPSPTPSPSPSPTPTPSPSPTSPSPSPTSPSPSAKPSPSPTPSSGGSTQPSPSPSPPPTPQGQPQADNQTNTTIELTQLRFRTAILKITSNKPIKAYIKYGINGQLNLATKQTDLGTSHEVSLIKEALFPGTTYSYVVVTEDAQGKITESQLYSLKTKGYKVVVTVYGKDHKLLKNKKIVLHSEPLEAETNDQGVATFTDVAPGEHKLEYTDKGKALSQTIQVEDSATADESDPEIAADQNFSIVYDTVAASNLPIAVIIAIIVIVLVGVAILVARRSNKLASGVAGGFMPNSQGPAPPPVSLPPVNDQTDNLLKRVPGAKHSDPGTVITPGNDKDKRGQNGV
jgi:hypothetical protein